LIDVVLSVLITYDISKATSHLQYLTSAIRLGAQQVSNYAYRLFASWATLCAACKLHKRP